jgi:hypothetical protein
LAGQVLQIRNLIQGIRREPEEFSEKYLRNEWMNRSEGLKSSIYLK